MLYLTFRKESGVAERKKKADRSFIRWSLFFISYNLRRFFFLENICFYPLHSVFYLSNKKETIIVLKQKLVIFILKRSFLF